MLLTRHPPRVDEWFARRRRRALDDLTGEALAEPEIAGRLDGHLTAARLRAEVAAHADTEVFPAAGAEQATWERLARDRLPYQVRESHRTGPPWFRPAGRGVVALILAGWAGLPIGALVWGLTAESLSDVLDRLLAVAVTGLVGAAFGLAFAGLFALIARLDGEPDNSMVLPMAGGLGLTFAWLAAFCISLWYIEQRTGVTRTADDPSGLMFPMTGILATIVLGMVALGLLVNAGPADDGDLDLPMRPDAEAERAYQTWRTELRENGLLPFLRRRINAAVAARYSLTLDIQDDAPGLRSRRATTYHVATPATEQLLGLLDQLDGGSFALAGARGTGKTMLLNALRDGRHRPDGRHRDLVVLVPAPVEYAPRDFVLHLYLAVCDAVESYFTPHLDGPRWRRRPGLPRDVVAAAGRQRDHLRYVESRTHEVTGKVGIPKWGPEVSGKAGRNRQAQPLTYPEIVGRLHGFLGHVGAALRQLPAPAPKLLIGIDELDRIGSGESAQRFLNDIKGIFDAPDCYFVVSVSEDALRTFALAGHGLRDVFDSTFDEMVRVDHLDFARAGDLLARRVVGLSEQFVALAYCLSGGLPRQLIRVARQLVGHRGRTLAEVTRAVVRQHLDHLVAAVQPSFWCGDPPAEMTESALLAYAGALRPAGPAAAAHVTFLATVVAVFDNSLDADRTKRADFDALARVRRYLGTDDDIAMALLAKVRTP